jgi:short-subunit dehydrogenase
MSFKNKICWVTGASSGIGEALCLEMAKQGAQLILSARNEEKLTRTKEECLKNGAVKCVVIPLDLSDSTSIDKAFDSFSTQFTQLDFLVNNGGISQRGLAEDTGIDVDRRVMEVNFFGAVNLTKKVLPIMLKQGSGSISVTSSVVGKFGFPLRTAYSASKHAVQGFFESLRAEVGEKGLNVSIIIAGRIKTNISLYALEADGNEHGKMDQGQENGMPAEVAAQKIASALLVGKKEILVGGEELRMLYVRRLLPFLYHKIVTRIKST